VSRDPIAEGVRFVRGDMPGWSDLRDAAPGGPVLRHLVRSAVGPSDHVLLAGPHDWALVDDVVELARRTTLLLRGVDDARTARARYADRSIDVVCGDVGALSTDGPADLLVALDGLERTVSLERDAVSWAAVWDELHAHVAPDARDLVVLENPLSVVALTARPPQESRDDDAAWRPLELWDGSRPRSIEQLERHCRDARILALHPDTVRPTLVTGGDGPEGVVVAHNAVAGGAVDRASAMRAAVLAADVRRHAAGWIVATRSPVPDGGALRSDHDGTVWVVDLDRRKDPPVSTMRRATRSEGTGPVDETAPARPVDGPLLDSMLLDAGARRDDRAVRDLVRVLVDTLRGAEPDERRRWSAATFDNVLVGPSRRLTILDRSGPSATPAEPDDLAIALLDDFAAHLVRLGWRHPWPVAASLPQIGALLAAAGGVDADADRVLRVRARGLLTRSRGDVPADPPADRARARLEATNEALTSKVEWFEAHTGRLERDLIVLRRVHDDDDGSLTDHLRSLEHRLASIEGSTSLRIGRAVVRPAQMVARGARRAFDRRRDDAGAEHDGRANGGP
jgi:hypothetical protein